MKFQRYPDTDSFAADTLEILLENEAQNNLPISFINNKTDEVQNWLLATIKDDHGSVVLTAACTPPFNLLLYETRNQQNDAAVALLSKELKSIGFSLSGVMADQDLAQRFATAYMGNAYHRHCSMHIIWEQAFRDDCHVENYPFETLVKRIEKRIENNNHYIWEDVFPVSQAVYGRSTLNCAVVSYVYTPPHYRGKGYASACVASLSKRLLEKGYQSCVLFADADNPISCGVYRKIGYKEICLCDELRFCGKDAE